MNKDLISVIVPCFNQAQYLPEALQSVLEQTYQNWECIIVNDGSPDNTHEVAQEWLAKDTRFIYIQKENGGLSSARNAGLDIAIGEYIQFLDSDDVLLSNKFKRSIDTLIKEYCQIVVSNFRMFLNDSFETNNPFCILKLEFLNYESILYEWDISFSIPIHCGFFRRSLFQVFRFPIDLRAKEDWIMWISIFKENPSFVFIDETLVLYRLHSNSMTKDFDMMKNNLLFSFIYLKNHLSTSEFEKLFFIRIGNLVESVNSSNNEIASLKIKFRDIKNSNTYKIASRVRGFLEKIGLLGLLRVVVNKILKLVK